MNDKGIQVKDLTEKLTFLIKVYRYIVRIHSKCDIYVLPSTTMCDMTYIISKFTQVNLITVVEIVFQSSCNHPLDLIITPIC